MNTLNDWISKASDPDNVYVFVQTDTLEEASQIEHDNIICKGAQKYKTPGVTGPCQSLIYMIMLQSVVQIRDDDMIIFASDDFFPPEDWDEILEEHAWDGALIFNDTIQGPGSEVVTLPILNYGTLKRLNYKLYPTAYHHSYSDNELYLNLKDLNSIKDLRSSHESIIFEHRHHGNGKRPVDLKDRSFLRFEREDKKIWESRKRMTLEERLNIELST